MSTGLFLTNGQWRPYPQGYMFAADIYCPDHIAAAVTQTTVHSIMLGSRYSIGKHGAEEWLEQEAKDRGIDYSDEYSYDSDDFPKVIADTDEENHCATCGVDLREV